MKPTICYECTNFLNLEPNSPRRDVWYNHLCTANKLPSRISLTTGKKEYYAINDLGDEYSSDREFKYCRDCNNGKCKMFVPKNILKVIKGGINNAYKN